MCMLIEEITALEQQLSQLTEVRYNFYDISIERRE